MPTAISEETYVSLKQAFLDRAYTHLLNGNTAEGIDLICDTLRRLKSILEPEEWDDYIENICMKHPIVDLLHQDPFTWRSYSKPRGYAGDAKIIDYIYGFEDHKPAPEGTSEIGKQIFKYGLSRPAPVAVRERRRIAASNIDAVANKIHKPRILALAAGCLREAEISSAVKEHRIGELVALDQDPESLAIVKKEYSKYGVSTLCADICSLMKQYIQLGEFDFVYATGLFDYLNRPFARRFARIMLAMTKPGGQVMIPNFVPDIPEVGYMEAFMDWKLVYRDGDDLLDLFDQSDLSDYDLFEGENKNIAYLIVRKPKNMDTATIELVSETLAA
jgi:extracellular factor (EF) 3-hydroxypalmitic acid methyl ester biosynthesis protein